MVNSLEDPVPPGFKLVAIEKIVIPAEEPDPDLLALDAILKEIDNEYKGLPANGEKIEERPVFIGKTKWTEERGYFES